MWYTNGRNGLNPSLDKTSLTLREYSAKCGCNLSKSFHVIPSAGCLNFPSLERSSSCHLKESVVFEHKNSLLSRGINGMCLNVFAENQSCFFEGSSARSNSGDLIYRKAPQVWKNSSSLWSFLINMHSLGHASIFS